MKNTALVIMVLLYWGLHQDIWNWKTAEPFAFGFLPAGLSYHALYTIGISFLMWILVKFAWPSELERDVEGPGLAKPPREKAR